MSKSNQSDRVSPLVEAQILEWPGSSEEPSMRFGSRGFSYCFSESDEMPNNLVQLPPRQATSEPERLPLGYATVPMEVHHRVLTQYSELLADHRQLSMALSALEIQLLSEKRQHQLKRLLWDSNVFRLESRLDDLRRREQSRAELIARLDALSWWEVGKRRALRRQLDRV